MSFFHDKKPIFLQIKEKIEDQIFKDQIKEHEKIPSTTQMVQFYKVNHITVSKGINLLVDEGIIYKRRGVGMFVAKGAKEKLVQHRKDLFADTFVLPMLQEAEKLSLTDEDIYDIIQKLRGHKEDGI
ncbi:GntR family transcriptional regulator [Anaerobacillus alkalilacustris]|uniref:GntR family transcriptional regulator n=1 Tax=Anaerobacillus alkalilacustris TaxID=393763 RepID=A0A1S2LGM6_9BACI|nr:GntR family transcriptional regulator [Anaerobacillus alkalilacustris]OIJ11464.1 GntR family transcriptional regulator [Anaerobacillus alkalilacustris]